MVGSRRDERFGAAIATTNIFCALESRRRRKKPQEEGSVKKSDNNNKSNNHNGSGAAFSASAAWIPGPVTVSSWADCEDDDEDYFANAPLPSVLWGSEQRNDSFDRRDNDDLAHEEEEDDIDQEESEEDEDANDEAKNEPEMKETEVESEDRTSLNMQRNFAVQREPERQLSRKDQKKKEMAELDAVLAEFSLNREDEKGYKENDSDNLLEDKESEPVQAESRRNAKRKKPKKGKSLKEERADLEVPNILNGDAEEDAEPNSIAPVDPKEVMKKLALMKKKKSPKENDSAAKVAAAEAATRAAKLAAAKKKEKNHYNQRPPAR